MGSRHNPNLVVSSRFFTVGGLRKIPRVEVVVEGYQFIFGRDAKHQVMLVSEPPIGNGIFRNRVKQEAHVRAGAVFNQELGRSKELRQGKPEQLRLF